MKTSAIGAKNDQIRRTGNFGPDTANPLRLSPAVQEMGNETLSRLYLKCMSFDEFDTEDDPWGDHDFGVMTANDQTVLFKIDIEDDASETRVFSFMTPDEM